MCPSHEAHPTRAPDDASPDSATVVDGVLSQTPLIGASVLGRADTGARANALLRVQQGAGNVAAQAYLHGAAPVLARQQAPAAEQPAPAGGAGLALLTANKDHLNGMRAEALVLSGKLVVLEKEIRESIDATRGKLQGVSNEYDKAYERYATIIKTAKKEAMDQQQVTDVVVGIAIGVLVGVAIEGVVAATAAAAAAEAAAAVAKAAAKAPIKTGLKEGAKAIGTEAAGEGAEAGLGAIAKELGLSVAGTDLRAGRNAPGDPEDGHLEEPRATSPDRSAPRRTHCLARIAPGELRVRDRRDQGA